jgi:AraC-like DNA-binding protein
VLPPYVQNLLKIGSFLFYMLLQARLLYRFVRTQSPDVRQHLARLLQWLALLTLLLALIAGSVLIALVARPLGFGPQAVAIMAVGLGLLAMLLFLLFHPAILYGIPFSVASDVQEPERKTWLLDAGQTGAYRRQLDAYMAREPRPFLRRDFKLRTMVEETGIPRHHLSELLNEAYGMHFNDFVNQHRIAYVIEHFDRPAWTQLTLEGIGAEAGFNSRNTFIRAFKKVTGMTPSEYRDRIAQP